MLKVSSHLIAARGIEEPAEEITSAIIAEDKAVFVNQLVNDMGVLPPNPPFELHPYKDILPLSNHGKYIVGTFPPISYILDNPELVEAGIEELSQPDNGGYRISRPWIPFYHGNAEMNILNNGSGSMWQAYLSVAEKQILIDILNTEGRIAAKQYLVDLLQLSCINYADIIDSCQRMLSYGRYDAGDERLYNITVNDGLISHLLLNPHSHTLLFNTSSIFRNNGLSFHADDTVNLSGRTTSFDLFIKRCELLGLLLEIRIQYGKQATLFDWTEINQLNPNQRRTKIVFEMRITNPAGNEKFNPERFRHGSIKSFTVVTPFSPAAVNRGSLRDNSIVKNWLINTGRNTSELLSLAYQSFRNHDFAPLYELNL